MVTASQFAWTCADAGDYPPPPPKKKGASQFGKDAACWLCGGPTGGVGWPKKLALAPTFCDHNSAARLDSGTVCQACVATSSTAGWIQYASKYPERELWTHFPDKGNGKAPRGFNWLYSSHVFWQGGHEAPSRVRWREILADPPEPPFLMIMAINGKKQILFRGRVSQSKESFWVQADEQRILVSPEKFAACIAAFEDLYNAGFSKDSIVSGEYHTGQLAKVGIRLWRELEAKIEPWRRQEPGLMLICHHCAQRTEEEQEDAEKNAAVIQQPVIETKPAIVERGQMGLF